MTIDTARVRKIRCTNDYFDVLEPNSVVWWDLYSLNGKKIYGISNINEEVSIINLSDRNIYKIYPGTRMILNVYGFAMPFVPSEVYIEYCPDSQLTAHFKFSGVIGDYELIYEGTW